MQGLVADKQHSKIHTYTSAEEREEKKGSFPDTPFVFYRLNLIGYAHKGRDNVYRDNIVKNIIFHKITATILHHLYRFFNLFFQFVYYPLFKARYVGLRNAQRVSHLLLGVLAVSVHPKPHFHYLLFARRQTPYNA